MSNDNKKQIKALQKLKAAKIPELLKNRNMFAKVIDCYDGDTCTIVFLLNKSPIKLKLRLEGIDTAEKPRRKDGSDRARAERELFSAAHDFLAEYVLNQCVYVELKKWGKWGGRVIGAIYCIDSKGNIVGDSLSDQLLTARLAVVYAGKKKNTDWSKVHQTWKEWTKK